MGIYAGMQMWMRKTCIKFVPAGSAEARSTGHSHYITIFSGRGCYSSVGYNHRSHQVSLQARGCTVPSNMRHNFNKVSGTSTFGLPSDYCSLMHYGATAFGGRSFTIVPKDLDYLA